VATTRLTIADVASRAGVSVATVSRVVNGRYGVSPETSSRVREVIDQLGYASSLGARSLRSERTQVIGVLMSRIEPFGVEVLTAVSDELQESGYELLVYCPTSEHIGGWERTAVSRLGGTLVDGCILVAPTVVDVSTERPVVAVDPHVDSSNLPTVIAENHAGAVAATRHLIEIGHRRIGFLGGRSDIQSARERERGYRFALEDAGISVDPELIQNGDYTDDGAERPARTLLSLPDRPTAIFAANDRSALRLIEIAHEVGLDVPDALSVVGFDDIPHAALTSPALTTIDQSLRGLGREAVRILLDLIAGGADDAAAPVHRHLPVELVVRDSTAPPRRRQ